MQLRRFYRLRGGLCLLAVVTYAGRLAAQELLHTFDQPQGLFTRLAFSDNDAYLAALGSLTSECNAIVWDLRTGRQSATLLIDGRGPEDIVFVPGQTSLALFDFPLGEVTFWDYEQNQTRTIQLSESGTRGAKLRSGFGVSPDGKLVAVGMHRARIDEWFVRVARADDGSVVADLKVLGLTRRIYFGADGSSVFAAEERNHQRPNRFAAYVHEWDVASGEKLHEWGPFPMTGIKQRGRVVNMSVTHLSANGRRLASPHGDRIVAIDVATGSYATVGPHPVFLLGPIAGEFSTSVSPYRALAFDPQAYVLATGCIGSGSVYLWPIAASGAAERLEQPDLSEVRGLRYSRSGRFLIVAGRGPDGGKLHVWQMATERSIQAE